MLAYDGRVISKRELTGRLTAAVECDPLIRPDALPACRVMVCRLIPEILRILRYELRHASKPDTATNTSFVQSEFSRDP
jgi:hypothetical protein